MSLPIHSMREAASWRTMRSSGSHQKMIEDGADILDVGGYSSRPGAENITAEEERTRVIKARKTDKPQLPEANHLQSTPSEVRCPRSCYGMRRRDHQWYLRRRVRREYVQCCRRLRVPLSWCICRESRGQCRKILSMMMWSPTFCAGSVTGYSGFQSMESVIYYRSGFRLRKDNAS